MSENKQCIALISGGIDSPVAIARMLSDGWNMQCVHFNHEEIVGDKPLNRVVKSLQHLLKIDGRICDFARELINPELIVVDVSNQLSKFTEKWAHTEYFIHMKRMFHRIADNIGKELGATHILTGENLGQVSSQTLGNIGAIEKMTDLIPIRPLLTMDKRHIIEMARELGTYRLSVGEEICDAFGPKKPTTVANKEWLELSEQRAGGMDNLVNSALETKYSINLTNLT